MKPPIKNFSMKYYPEGTMTQDFGENPVLYSRWGMKGHNGQDHVAPHGEPMYAIEDAKEVSVKNDPSGFGKHVRIRSINPENGVYRIWTYGHCSKIYVAGGQIVEAGEHIADMGNTGYVVSGASPFWEHNPFAGTHLHLGMRLVKEDKKGWKYPHDDMKIKVMNYNNGYKGAVDPTPYLEQVSDEETYRQQLLTVVSLLRRLKQLLLLRG